MPLIYNYRRQKIIFIVSISILMVITISQHFSINPFRIEISQLYLPLCPYSFKVTGNHIIFDDESYSIHHYPEFICPQNFRNLADWIYGWPEGAFNEDIEYSLSKNKIIVPNLPDGSIIYVKADNIRSFFSKIYPYLLNKFILITGQGDTHVPSQYLHYLDSSDSKLIHWFGQNGDITAERSERFTHIPIGKDRIHN